MLLIGLRPVTKSADNYYERVTLMTDAVEKVEKSIKPKIPPNEAFSDFRN